jgi:hypothetical protein
MCKFCDFNDREYIGENLDLIISIDGKNQEFEAFLLDNIET